MDDEKIFGPLTARQFLYVVAGAGLVYVAYRYLGPRYGALLAVFVAGVTFGLVRHAVPPPFDEAFVRGKLSALGREDFAVWRRRKIAELASHEAARAERGLSPDPGVAAARALIDRVAAEAGIA